MILVTGADGYLGLALVRRYVAGGDDVIACVRATDARGLERKRQALRAGLGPSFAKIRVIGAELRNPRPFAAVRDDVTEIVHAAAVTRFDVARRAAYDVNVEGTAKIAAFAARCRRLRALTLVGSIHATGLTSGPILEEPIRRRPPFANWYEWSKCLAEEVVVERCANLPWRIVRIATAVADDESGRATQRNAVHDTLRLLWQGLLSVLPGDPATLVYFVTRDYAADACVTLARDAPAQRFYHVCPQAEHALALGDVLRNALGAFGESAEFRRRRVLQPSFCDWESFERLRHALEDHGSVLASVVGGLAPFARQLYVSKRVDNRSLAACLEPPCVTHELVRRVCGGLMQRANGRSES
jgi:nucleoside-diphosphate-sugar epimerase